MSKEIRVPNLERLSKAAIVAFRKAYMEYERDLESANRDKSKNQQQNKRSTEECIDSNLLEEIKEHLAEANALDDLSWDEQLNNFLDSILASTTFEEKKLHLVSQVGKVRLDSKVEDPKSRVMMFKTDLRRVLRENGLEPAEVFDNPKMFGEITKLMVENKKCFPGLLRAWVKHVLEGNRGNLTAKELTAHLEAKCEHLEAVNLMQKLCDNFGYENEERLEPRLSRKNSLGKFEHGTPSKKKRSFSPEPKLGTLTPRIVTEAGSRNHKKIKTQLSGQDGPKAIDKRSKCWGCGQEGHTLRDCKIISDEAERERVVAEKRESFKKVNKVSSPYASTEEEAPRTCKALSSQSIQHVQVKLEGISTKVLLDTGSDRSLMSKTFMHHLEEQTGKKFTPILLQSVQKISLADPSLVITTDSYLELTITFQVYQALRLKSRKFFLVDEDIGTPIIGNHELIEIGIDPITNLERLSYIQDTSLDKWDELDETVSGSSSVDLAIQQMLQRARQNGMSDKWWKQLCNLVKEYQDVFRLELGNDPPAKVTPMDVSFLPAKANESWKTYNMKYTDEELVWLKRHIGELEKFGYVYRNPHARFASPALVIAKPGQLGEFRLCVNVAKANSMVFSTHWPMPNIDVVIRKLGRSTVYAKLDAFKGYWLFPCTKPCGELYSIKTPFGIFTPTRIVQGAQEAVRYFQAGMEEALNIGNREDLLLWVDDILAHNTTPEELLKSLLHIFRCCRDRQIRLSAKKCDLFLTKVTWCGRTITSKGVGYDPEYIQGVLDLEEPRTVGDLQQYVCSMNWVRNTIPHYNREMEPLLSCLKNIESKIGSNKKAVLSRRQISNYEEWNDEVRKTFLRSKELLKTSIISTHHDSSQRLCVFPDASDGHYGLFITQVPAEDLDMPFEEQRHSPLLMLSGSFTGSSKRWHIREKEAYPIMVAIDKARDLLKNPDGFSLFSDHKNLVWLLDTERRQIVKHADDRLSRWALKLSGFRFSIEHISGDQNVVADMLSRWRVLYPQTVCGAFFQPGTCSHLHKSDFVWPSLDQVSTLQGGLSATEIEEQKLSPKLILQHTVFTTKSGRIYIPESDLRTRLCVIAHSGLAGHRGIDQTFKALKKLYYWPKMFSDVKKFCKACLHCAVADPRQVIPRPLGTQMHATSRNEILHYDFIHIGSSDQGYSYMLVIKDDFTGFVDMFPCQSPTRETVITSLLKWYSLFGVALCHISDQGSHFKNEVVSELNRRLVTNHHFTLPYTPWSNGTIERVNKEIRRLLKVWVSEFRISLRQWPALIPLMVHVLNYSVSPRTGYPPALLFGGFSTVSTVTTIFSRSQFKQSKATFEEMSNHLNNLRNTLEELHREIPTVPSRRGNYSMIRDRPNFDVGDYVMFATRRFDQGPSKNSRPKWTGPYKVVSLQSDWDFTIEHLVSGNRFHAHCSRLKYYSDQDLHVDVDLKHQITHDEMRYKVLNILNHSVQDGVFKLLIEWQGFDEEEATWEPFDVIKEDVPDMVNNYLSKLDQGSSRNKELIHRARG